MDEINSLNCLNCGEPLKEPRKLRQFCCYSCRGQHAVQALDGAHYQSALVGSKNLRRTKALQTLKRGSVAGLSYERVNPLTYRIDRPSKKRGVGWLMEVAWPGEKQQRWVARVGKQASEPSSLDAAKRAAAAMLAQSGIRIGASHSRGWIRELNQIAADEVDRAYLAGKKQTWPINLMGGQRGAIDRKLRRAILDTELEQDDPASREMLLGNDYPLEYYDDSQPDGCLDGYPKLPVCLDRRKL